MSWLARIKDWFMNIFNTTKLEQAFGIKIASDVDFQELIQEWLSIYRGNPSWIGGADNQVQQGLNVASTMCRDLAGKIVSEIEITDNATENEPFMQFAEDELNQQIRQQIEYALATGAFICRPYYNTSLKTISLSWYSADKFIPTEWSGKRCVSGIFIDQDVVNDNGTNVYYTKLELQKFNFGTDGANSIDISVKLYKSASAGDLGTQVALTSYAKWADISPEAHVDNCKYPLFVYAAMPFANNKNLNSYAGVSLYKDGIALLEQIDRCWDNLNWEIQSSQNKVFVDEQMLETYRTENGDIVPRLDSKQRRLFQVMDAQGAVSKYMDTYSPAIRQADITATIKTNLSLLCSVCGLDSGAYVYDEQSQAVTATEIRTKNQRTYQLICDIQKWTIAPAVKYIINAVKEMQALYGVQEFSDIDVSVAFGDSILVDVDTDKKNAQAETTLGLRSKISYMMEYRGLSEEEARQELAAIQSETPEEVDYFGGRE